MISARGATAIPGRLVVALIAGAWCIATFACDTNCRSSDGEFEMTDADRTQAETDTDARDGGEPPEATEATHSEQHCANSAESFNPIVAERAVPGVKRMLEVAREVGSPDERLNRTWWTGMPIERCRDLVKLPDGATHCSVRHAARGRALVMRAEVRESGTGDAGSPSSSDTQLSDNQKRRADRLYVIGPKEGPVALPAGGLVQFLSVAPGLRYAVYDSVPTGGQTGDPETASTGEKDVRGEIDELENGRTYRVDLRTGDTCRLATCLRPVVSPQDRWVVCRRANGGVARVSLGGGQLETYRSAQKLDGSQATDTGATDTQPQREGRTDAGMTHEHVPGPASFPSVDVLMVPTRSGAARTFAW